MSARSCGAAPGRRPAGSRGPRRRRAAVRRLSSRSRPRRHAMALRLGRGRSRSSVQAYRRAFATMCSPWRSIGALERLRRCGGTRLGTSRASIPRGDRPLAVVLDVDETAPAQSSASNMTMPLNRAAPYDRGRHRKRPARDEPAGAISRREAAPQTGASPSTCGATCINRLAAKSRRREQAAPNERRRSGRPTDRRDALASADVAPCSAKDRRQSLDIAALNQP